MALCSENHKFEFPVAGQQFTVTHEAFTGELVINARGLSTPLRIPALDMRIDPQKIASMIDKAIADQNRHQRFPTGRHDRGWPRMAA